ncbi:MAG: AI-2E family transporter [Luteolibacter sp.]
MAIPIKKASQADSLSTISNVLLTAFIISALYFGRELLVPLALAALLTFMLAPLVTRFQRWMGRVGAVLFVVAIIFSLTLGAGWVLTRQAMDMATTLPNYKENIRTKLRSVRIPDNGPFSRISNTLEELKKDLPGGVDGESPLATGTANKSNRPPQPVEIVNGPDKRLEFVQLVIAPVLGPLGTGALVLLLLVFMLLEREDLRNRMIRLIGQGRIGATSRAMDDAGSRVSKYLQMQLIVNSSYGLAVAIGLYFIGVPNALLWGALATVLRFIPYIGPWIAAAFPIVLSLAISDGWMAPLLTVSLYIVIELISNNVMEPWLYGSSTGVTPIALIVAALVWTWLWGPVGLVLATPLTVCLVVMGRHIPRLAFFSIALSHEEALTPAEDCYHRLHRVGEHEEMELVDTYLKSNPLGDLFDSVLVPVIIAAESDHRSGLLETEQLEFVERGMLGILEDLELRQDNIAVQPVLDDDDGFGICCLPTKAWRDELAGSMLAIQLKHHGYQVQNASARMVTGELVAWVREQNADIVCVSAVTPTSVNQVRYLCLKLRAGFPDLKIIVGMWGAVGNAAGDSRMLRESGANEVVTSISEAAVWVRDHAPLSMVVDEEVA